MNHILDRLWSSNTERLCNRTSFFGGNLPFSKDGIHQGDKAIRGNAHNRPGKGRNAAIRSQKVNSACCDARIADEISKPLPLQGSAYLAESLPESAPIPACIGDVGYTSSDSAPSSKSPYRSPGKPAAIAQEWPEQAQSQ